MKIAVVGAWHVHTMEYAETIQKHPAAELACLWDDDHQRGKATAEKLGIPFVADLETIWNDNTIDGVQITAATAQHTEILLAAARAKKHIFTEKVLTLTNEDAQKIAEAVKAAGITFTISYPHKTWPTLKAAKAILDSGKLGRITYARVRNAHNGSSADWLPPHFYDETQTGGGAMIDLGAHPMYTLSWLMGKPVSVVSQFTQVTNRGVEDNAVSVLEFEGGAIGVSETGFVTTGNPYVLELSGTEGSLMVHNDTLEVACKDTAGKLLPCTDLPAADPLPLNAWLDALNGQGEAPNGIDEAVELTRFMAAAYESYKTGKKVFF